MTSNIGLDNIDIILDKISDDNVNRLLIKNTTISHMCGYCRERTDNQTIMYDCVYVFHTNIGYKLLH